MCGYELSSMLLELINLLTMEFKARTRPLNPMVILCRHKKKKETKEIENAATSDEELKR